MSFFCALRIEISKLGFQCPSSRRMPSASLLAHAHTAENQSKTLRDSMLHIFWVFHRTSGGLIFLKKGLPRGCLQHFPSCL